MAPRECGRVAQRDRLGDGLVSDFNVRRRTIFILRAQLSLAEADQKAALHFFLFRLFSPNCSLQHINTFI
jgi:hypothetical protein